ncbi:MAG: NADP-dependent oxidoreductase [Ferruginibacter sp.]|nr:NADP-dependent oxidoreductase [Ferruginibacter sp.]
MTTQQIVLAARPKGLPVSEDFRMDTVEIAEIKDGEILLKGLYYSVDPYMRGRMNDAKSYVPPFDIDQPLNGAVIAEVVESRSDKFRAGDLVAGNLPWQKIIVSDGSALKKVDPRLAAPSHYLGVLGMTGLTAYFGLMHIGKPQAGETVVVSGAAGAVGLVVGQIAEIQECHVVGIAGSEDKTKLLLSLGFDVAINYKTTPDMKKAIAAACPKGVDVYFDNVGGGISDAVIANIAFHARIPLCGQISLYNSEETPMGPRLQPMLLTRSVLMQGFIISQFQEHFPEGIQQLAKWIKEDKIKVHETIEHGFENLPNALLGLFKGENTGKMIVKA